jgi:hypothetical protein
VKEQQINFVLLARPPNCGGISKTVQLLCNLSAQKIPGKFYGERMNKLSDAAGRPANPLSGRPILAKLCGGDIGHRGEEEPE